MSFLLQRGAVSTIVRACVTYTKQLKIEEQQLLPPPHLNSIRTKSTLPPTSQPWTPIYHLPLIRWAASFNRLKIYQTVVTAAGVPAAYALEQAGMLTSGSDAVFAIVGVSGFLTMTLFSLGSRNLVGFIYINEQQDRIKLAYVDFWGRRQETEISADDIVPEHEQKNPSRYDLYKNICLYSDPKRKYKLLHRFAIILEPQKFVTLIGD